jgi:hypothetical protein
MFKAVVLTETEVFALLEDAIAAAVDRVADTTQLNLPSRHYESQTLLGFRFALMQKKIEKYEFAITDLIDRKRLMAQRLGKSLEQGLPTRLAKSNIEEADKAIHRLILAATTLAIGFGYKLVGAVNPDTGKYVFDASPIRDVFTGTREFESEVA